MVENYTQAVNLTNIINDPSYTITYKNGVIHLWASSIDSEEKTADYPVDTKPGPEFNGWDEKQKQAYLIGYMDARTDMDYMYDFNSEYQRYYELGRVHGEHDGIWDDSEED